jgi:hypothetical protein
MLLVVQILMMAVGFFGQAKLIPDERAPVASELDSLTFPPDHPEWVLARRAMASEGLCHPGPVAAKDTGLAESASAGEAPVHDLSIVRLVAEACN